MSDARGLIATTASVAPSPGLTSAQVAERVAAGEADELTHVTSRPLLEIIKANVLTRFNAVLGALFALVMLTGRWLAGLLGLALVVNAGFGIAQEWSAKRKLDSLAVLNAPSPVIAPV